MFTVGITGGIATGKSTATYFFAKKGIDIIDADEISRNLQEKGQVGYEAIVKKYGNHFPPLSYFESIFCLAIILES